MAADDRTAIYKRHGCGQHARYQMEIFPYLRRRQRLQES